MNTTTNESLKAAAELARTLEDWRSAGGDSASVVLAIARFVEALMRPGTR